MHSAGVTGDLIIWAFGNSAGFLLRAKTAAPLLSCLFTLQIPMTAALIPGKCDHVLSRMYIGCNVHGHLSKMKVLIREIRWAADPAFLTNALLGCGPRCNSPGCLDLDTDSQP